MKHLSLITILTLLFLKTVYSQKDTVSIKVVEVIENKLPPSFKTTQFDSSEISDSENLSELLSKHSTVFIKTYGSGSLATVSFRGTGASHTKVQWNGVTLNSPMNGQIDFSLYPTFFFDNANLHFGASGLIDGNGALGGSVLMSNSETYNKGLSTNITQKLGSFSKYKTTATVNYSTSKWSSQTKLYHLSAKNDFEYINSSKKNNPTETQTNANLKQFGVLQSIYRKFKNSRLGTRLWYFNSDRNLPHAMNINDNDENQKDESFRGLIEWKGLHKNLQYQLSSAIVKDQLIYDNQLAGIYSKNNSLLSVNNINTTLYLKKNIIINNKINIKYETAKAAGYDKNYQRFNNSWLLSISKNFNRLFVDMMNRLIVVGENFQPISPSIGMRFKILKKQELHLKMNAGINYNYPTFNDLYWNPGGNTALRPEESKMSESGLSYSKTTKKSSFHTEITAFYGLVDDWIIWQPTEFGYWSPLNLKKIENKGFETLIHYDIKIKKLKINNRLNYSYTVSTNKTGKTDNDKSIDKQLIYVPFHQFNYGLTASYKTLSLSYTYSYTGKRYTTSDNNWYLPGNFLSDISLRKQITLKDKTTLSLTLKAKNIFNQAYQSIAWRAMPGRNYLISLALFFN